MERTRFHPLTRAVLVTALAATAALVAVAGNGGLRLTAPPAEANFHLMRIYGVMAGTGGSTNIQYVELRMTADSQNVVDPHQICFYDSTDMLTGVFNFPGDALIDTNHSILIGTTQFRDDLPAVIQPDFVFDAATMTPSTNTHPVPTAGRIVFGTQVGMVPCSSIVDSVAYGGYMGSQPMIFGTPDDEVIPTTDICDDPPDDLGSFACALTFVSTLVCPPTQFGCPTPANNKTDYTVKQAAPCNNAGGCSSSVTLDNDGDGIPDATDPDDDNDKVYDVAEGPCGGDPMNAGKRPERLDLLGDDDVDGMFNEALPSPASDLLDCDGDGWSGSAEKHIFSAGATANDQDPCGASGWPADMLSPDFLLENGISILDLADFIDPVRWFDSDVADWPSGQQAAARRHDLQPGDPFGLGAEINILDLAMLVEVNPPPAMLGVSRVFDTTCPWPG